MDEAALALVVLGFGLNLLLLLDDRTRLLGRPGRRGRRLAEIVGLFRRQTKPDLRHL